MNKAVGVLKMHWRDKWTWAYIPWLICFGSFLVNVIVGLMMPTDAEYYTGGISALFIYFFIAGIVTPVQTFPFALGMGVRRSDYFLGTAALAVMFSAGSAALLTFLSVLEKATNHWGLGLHFFHLPFIHEGPLPAQWLTLMLLFLFVFFGGIFIAGINRRFGKIGLFVFFGSVLICLLVIPILVNTWGSWAAIGRWLEDTFRSANDLAPLFFIFTLIFSLISYMLFRRATV
jgi:hypothetical protein